MMKRRIVALLLLAALCACTVLPAMADEKTADSLYIGGTGQDTIYEATPLPNGNLLLTGYTQLGRNGREMVTGAPRQTRAWLVCLAPDGSILWEALDETEGTTRYVTPLLTSGGEIAVLFYNAPSQVTTEAAIHIYSMDGELLKKVPLPLEVGLVEGRMTDGFVFYDWEKGYMTADLNGTVRLLETPKADRVVGSGVASLVPYKDGWVIAGRSRDEDAGQVVAHFNRDGKRVWSFTTPELVEGFFSIPQLQKDGTLLVNWMRLDMESGDVLQSRMICLDENGGQLWEKTLPTEARGPFAVTDEGWVFTQQWMEKTYSFIRFYLVGEDGQMKEVRQAEKRRDTLYGGDIFQWNGEIWFHADAEREANRINDRQTDLELQDAMLVRMADCQPVKAE